MNSVTNGIKVIDLGLVDYDKAWSFQRELFIQLVDRKKKGLPVDDEWLLMAEHYPVVTLGKHAKESNLLLSDVEMNKLGVKCRQIERGGDVTFHGPGQLVVYPIIDLEKHKLGIRKYVELLEEAIIQTLETYGIKGERIAGASGVWIGSGSRDERKICAVGVKCSRFCVMHGLALNVTTDLKGFDIINPCGFTDKGVTSIKSETGRDINMDEVKERFKAIFLKTLQRN